MEAYASTIKQEYFDWLCQMVHREDWKAYLNLLGEMHRIIFIPQIEHDENRAEDGIGLRELYLMEECWGDGEELLNGECSMLEMIVALADRMAYELSFSRSRCFWEIVGNLGLEEYDDANFEELNGGYFTARVMDELINRTYEPNGIGGMFPLAFAEEDQRYVEIWYQMQDYIQERYRV